FAGRTSGPKGLCAARRCELNCRGADSRSGSVYQHCFAFLERCLCEERVVGGYENFRHSCGFSPIETRWDCGEMILRRQKVFGLCASASNSKNSIAFLPCRDIVADLRNLPRKLHSRYVRWKPGRRWIPSLAL